MKISEIARLLTATVEGDPDHEIRRVAKIEDAGEGDLTFLANPKYARYLALTRASAVIVGKSVKAEDRPPDAPPLTLLHVDDPYVGFVRVLALYNPPQPPLPQGIHPSAVIASSARTSASGRMPSSASGPGWAAAA
jgi:UDP-3-O-[3-hydroxymyristoyl] glucosamine N-acyltransferase